MARACPDPERSEGEWKAKLHALNNIPVTFRFLPAGGCRIKSTQYGCFIA